MNSRLRYLARILEVYLAPGRGPLSFWYETPEVNERAFLGDLDEYYMAFGGKANYRGPFDQEGIPLLDYRGEIGRQYNPIAIAQYGLACWNRWRRSAEPAWKDRFFHAADWLARNLKENGKKVPVWNHHFDWPYRQTLKAPWYSGLAQGQGISLLVRAAAQENGRGYSEAAEAAFVSFRRSVDEGGIICRDAEGHLWIEEYIVDPPSHILNGFIWALWGVYDFAKWSRGNEARGIFEEAVDTLRVNLRRYDAGYWSLYELPNEGPPMLASPYYHSLHIVQLRAMHRLTGEDFFREYADRWQRFKENRLYSALALARKAWYKIWRY